MGRILRGDIFWADLSPGRGKEQTGCRPVLVISHEMFNKKSGTVIALAITCGQSRAAVPVTLELEDAKLPKRYWVNVSYVRTLSTKRFGKKIGRADVEEMDASIEGLLDIVGK